MATFSVLEKQCLKCGQLFKKPYVTGMPEWNRRKYCSRRCINLGRKRIQPIN